MITLRSEKNDMTGHTSVTENYNKERNSIFCKYPVWMLITESLLLKTAEKNEKVFVKLLMCVWTCFFLLKVGYQKWKNRKIAKKEREGGKTAKIRLKNLSRSRDKWTGWEVIEHFSKKQENKYKELVISLK